MDDLQTRFLQYNAKEKLLAPTETILLAVSGGVDSVVLSHVCHCLKFQFAIAHCNFKLRGDESDADEVFVRNMAKNYNVPYHVIAFDTEAFKKKNKLSTEEAARILRYKWFEELCTEQQYRYIATAHHLNDSIETILLNMLRGTGISGLTGIAPKYGNIIRPLLFAHRQDIEMYAAEKHLEHRIDSSNMSNDFKRNKVRNEIIPLLKLLNPSLEQTFKKNIQHFNDVEVLYKKAVADIFKKYIQKRGADYYIAINGLKHAPVVNTWMHEFLSPFGFTEDQIVKITEPRQQTAGKFFYSNTHRVIIDREFIIVTVIQHEQSELFFIEEDDKTISCGGFKLKIETSKYKHIKFNTTGSIAYFDADKINYPLMLRRWKNGDYMYPIGLIKAKTGKQAKKKISDILTDKKVGVLQKENIWVLLNEEKIAWLVGNRQDERFKITQHTKKILKITVVLAKQ